MKRFLIMLIVLMASVQIFASNRYLTRSGHIHIISHTDIIDLEADNNQVACILDIETGEIVFSLLMHSFIFKEALAQEHFNENYAESETYPKSKFKGKVTNLSEINFNKDGKYPATVSGKLTMHGVTKEITAQGTFEIKSGNIIGTSVFEIDIYDYKIKIPKIVRDRVNNIIPITVEVELEKWSK